MFNRHRMPPTYGITIKVWECTKCTEVVSCRDPICICGAPRDPVIRKCCPGCGNAPEWEVKLCPQCGLDFETYKPPPERWRFRGYGW